MSKAKKAVYAEKQKAASNAASAGSMTPLSADGQMPKSAKKPSARKQSRGK